MEIVRPDISITPQYSKTSRASLKTRQQLKDVSMKNRPFFCSLCFSHLNIHDSNSLRRHSTMLSVLRSLLGLFLAFVLYKAVSAIVTTYRHAKAAKNNGCEPAPIEPSPDPLGLTNIMRLIQADKDGKLPDFMANRIEVLSRQEGRSVFTFQTHIARNWLFFTCDPKNIQALLATQFKDFELGPIRFGTFSPL